MRRLGSSIGALLIWGVGGSSMMGSSGTAASGDPSAAAVQAGMRFVFALFILFVGVLVLRWGWRKS